MDAPSSASRESITLVSSVWHFGQRILARGYWIGQGSVSAWATCSSVPPLALTKAST
jgi:hypothetical protein